MSVRVIGCSRCAWVGDTSVGVGHSVTDSFNSCRQGSYYTHSSKGVLKRWGCRSACVCYCVGRGGGYMSVGFGYVHVCVYEGGLGYWVTD